MVKRQRSSVLCVGNDPVHLNFRCTLLQECGWTVLSAGSGHDGVQRFERETVDAVVIDLDTDGSEAALITSLIKRTKPHVPVVMLVSGDMDLAGGAASQADAIVAKSEETHRLPTELKRLVLGRKGGSSK